jgi:phi13 family phage major tail protein
MAIKTKKPMIKETVGALYYNFNTPTESGEYNPAKYEEEVVKSNVVKNIGTTENAESVTVKASGEDYETVSQNQYIDMAVEVVAIDPGDLAKMRSDIIGKTGLNRSGRTARRPFFAFGKVKKMVGDGFEYAWYPKCQLIENTDDISTQEEKFSEQNDTVTIRAYSYNKEGDKKTYVNNEMDNFPEGMTEEKFFAKPLLTDEDLTAALTPGT